MNRWLAMGLTALIAAGVVASSAPARVDAGELPSPPLIEIVPGCMPASPEGSYPVAFDFRLRNFTPGVQVEIAFGDVDFQPPQTVTVDLYGALNTRLTFEFGASGDVPIVATEVLNRAMTASTFLHAPSRCEPVVQLTPICDAVADPMAPRALSIGVVATNWSFDPVTFQLLQRVDGTERQISDPVSGQANSDQPIISVVIQWAYSGSDDVSAPLMALPAGNYFVRAQNSVSEGPSTVVDVDFPVPCPAVTVSPTCGDEGTNAETYDIGIAGSGWRPFTDAQVIFDAAGSPEVFPLYVDASGTLTIHDVEEARIRPSRRPIGTYIVTVRQASPDGNLREASTSFQVECPPEPRFRVEPLCGPPQLAGDVQRTSQVRFVGENLPPGVLTIRIEEAARAGAPETFQFGVGGNLNETRDIARRPVGAYYVEALEEVVGAAQLTWTFTYVVPCETRRPRLRFRCEPRETTLPGEAEVVLEASRFYADAPLELTIGGNTETVQTDADGRYGRRSPSAGLPGGPLDASAVQRDVNGTVVVQAQKTLILPCNSRAPSLVISPPSSTPGFVVLVRGFNLQPNLAYQLRWSQGIGSDRTIDVLTDEDGVFERQVLLFHHDIIGQREMTIEPNADDPLAGGVSAPFVLAPGKGIPPTITEPEPGFPPLILRR